MGYFQSDTGTINQLVSLFANTAAQCARRSLLPPLAAEAGREGVAPRRFDLEFDGRRRCRPW